MDDNETETLTGYEFWKWNVKSQHDKQKKLIEEVKPLWICTYSGSHCN